VEDDRERTVTNLRKGVLALAAVAGAALLLGASPAWADDEDDAKDACKQIAENRDWDDTKAKVAKEGENRIVVTMTGERNNNDKERRCVYNTNSKEARFTGD
jgi:hypothetical protein